jgi:predicted Zn-dependent peptidase
MRTSRILTFACSTLAFLPHGLSGQSLTDFEQRVTESTLSNGLKVVLVERHDAPVAAFVNWVDVGSVNEVPGITGVSHLFEHMAFKGTSVVGTTDAEAEAAALEHVDEIYAQLEQARRAGDETRVAELEETFKQAQEEAGRYVVPNEFGRIIEREGGQGLNAFTNSDATVYFFSLPSNKSELWMWLESNRFHDGVLREFYKERDVVMEERRRSTESQPIGRLVEQFVAASFTAHPYRQPVVGYMSDLQSISRDDAEQYFRAHYIPQNMTIVIVGDIEPDATLKSLEAYFGRLPAAEPPDPVVTVEPDVKAERIVRLTDPGQPWYLVGYPIPSIEHSDYPALMALSELLSGGRTSRLTKRLVTDDKIAFFTGAFPGFPGNKFPSEMIFYATTAAGHTNAEVAAAMDEEITRLKYERVSEEELARVKTKMRANLVRQLDSDFGLALQLAEYQTKTGDWRNLFNYIEAIDGLTAEDLRRVATEYFVNQKRTVGEIVTEQKERV